MGAHRGMVGTFQFCIYGNSRKGYIFAQAYECLGDLGRADRQVLYGLLCIAFGNIMESQCTRLLMLSMESRLCPHPVL